MRDTGTSPGLAPGAAQKRPRDLRLDFFRGIAMFIILLAHTPGNTWTLWIPARFGFSDATEIFVFCSGMASALAFGAVFSERSFGLGTARIAFRVWQVYWAHIGILLVTALMLFAIDHYGVGNRDIPYIHGPYVVPLFEQTGEALIGLFTLTYVPGLFDILPMYLVILAMIPLVMLAHRVGGIPLAFALILVTWTMANLAGYARVIGRLDDPADWQRAIAAMGEPFLWMNLPSFPWGDNTWFFNPFAWQLIFFTGFAFGMGWLPAPPVKRWLVILAAAYVLLVLPFAWFKIHGGQYLPADLTIFGWSPHAAIAAARDFIEPYRWKTWQGLGRYTHFLALGYLAWVAVGPGGVRLREGYGAPGTAPVWVLGVAAALVVAFLPYVLVAELHMHAPGLEAWLLRIDWLGLTHITAEGEHLLADPSQIGLYQLLFGIALLLLVWAALPRANREWLTRDAFLRAVPVIRKVGTQSLAVFMVSIPLARFNGWVMDVVGRDVWTRAGVNLTGFAILIAVAYVVGWFKRQPWRNSARPAAMTQPPGGAARPERPSGSPVPAQRA
ncbi:MAG: OpgC domain-containing protein [Pseudomonadota bacterium]